MTSWEKRYDAAVMNPPEVSLKEWTRYRSGMTCGDCAHCRVPDEKWFGDKYDGIGWCVDCAEFVETDDSVLDMRCESFERL